MEICGICGEQESSLRRNLMTLKTKFSGTTVFQLLERFTERELSSWITSCSESGACSECFVKLNDYDAAYTKSLIIQQELTDLLKNSMLLLFGDECEPSKDEEIEDNDDNISWASQVEDTDEAYPPEDNCPREDLGGMKNVRISLKCHMCGEKFRNLNEVKLHSHLKLPGDEDDPSADDPIVESLAPTPPLVIDHVKIEASSCTDYSTGLEDVPEDTLETPLEVEYDDGEMLEEYYTEALKDDNEYYMEALKHGVESADTTDAEAKQAPLFECLYCDSTFGLKNHLKKHIKVHHAMDSGEEHVCKVCGFATKTRAALASHFGKHTRELNLVCSVCQKSFAQKATLERHMAIHTREKAFQCDLCGKQYLHYSSLYMHKLVHKNIRSKKCNICGFTLRSNSHLNRHMRTHSGEKPFACPECEQRFSQRYNMIQHMKMHQGLQRRNEKLFKCPLCDLQYGRKMLLKKHLSTKHGQDANSVADPSEIPIDSV